MTKRPGKLGQGRWRCVVGLTGGIGSGKSTVLRMFQKKGALVLDADAIVHAAYKKIAVLRKIKKEFGSDVVKKKQINRSALAQIVFASSAQRKKLEGILHPLVRSEMAHRLARGRGKVAVCDVPLLFEGGWNRSFDKVIVVNASTGVRLRRLKRRGIAERDARKRIKAQWPLSRKVRKADFVVHNDSTIKKTKAQVDSIWKNVLNPT